MKNKVFSFINIFGLTIGLASFLLISLYIFDELTFDRSHKNGDHIYRVISSQTTSEGKELKISRVGYQVSEKAKSDFPEIKGAVRILVNGRANVSTDGNTNVFNEPNYFVNQDFLTLFDFKLKQGDRNTALIAPNSVIVTEEMAIKLFGTTDVIGKSIKSEATGIPLKVTGVLENFPVNSHLSFNLCFSESTRNSEDNRQFASTDWDSGAFTTYLLLDGKADPHKVENKINQLVAKHLENGEKRSFALQALKDIHFYSADIEGGLEKKGSITYIYIFSIVAFFVLLIACINYMNLTTARFSNRAKEIAMRKVSGASRTTLISQFLTEAFLISIIALIFALVIVKALLPAFNTFAEKQLALGLQTDPRIYAGIVFIVIIVALISGIYPALFQSGSKPLLLLKNNINTGKGNLSIRRSLVVFQFTLSIIMIVATLIVYMQMQYVDSKDMGFNKELLIVSDINSGKVRSSSETIKSEFERLPGVKNVTVSSRVPGEWKVLPKVQVKNEKIQATEGTDMYYLAADERFLETYQMTLLSGRNFAKGRLADSSSVIVNETAAKILGITSPSEQLIEIPSARQTQIMEKPFTPRVIGIVKDFNFQSLREPVAPMIIANQSNPIQSIDYFTTKIAAGNMSKTLEQMEAVIHSIDQSHLFEYHFLDKQWDLFYREDQIRKTIFFIVVTLTIVIACLGLFGLATYAAEQRIKEIGIRKVLGASINNIVSMLSADFLKLVGIASLIAFPVAWYAMNKWLEDFAYRIQVSWWVFAIAGIIALLIALFTVSFQAIKAAVANPVKSLRAE